MVTLSRFATLTGAHISGSTLTDRYTDRFTTHVWVHTDRQTDKYTDRFTTPIYVRGSDTSDSIVDHLSVCAALNI